MNIIKLILLQLFIHLSGIQVVFCQESRLLDACIKNSNYIFEGVVISSTPFCGPDDKTYTSHIVKISKIFKGDLKCGNVAVINGPPTFLDAAKTIEESDAAVLEKGYPGIFMCINTKRPSINLPKENPFPLTFYSGDEAFIYYYIIGDTEIHEFDHPKINTTSSIRDYITYKTGINYKFCSIINHPCEPGEIKLLPPQVIVCYADTHSNVKDVNIEVHLSPTNILNIPITNEAQTSFSVDIYDKNGAVVLGKDNLSLANLQNLDLNGLKPDNYTGKVKCGNRLYHFKFNKK